MELYFCDRCNTSIPQRDVDAGIAILRAGRAYCASCKRIATGEETPRDVLFCDLCNVSVSVADMREERAVFREGRLYCAKCKFLVMERTATASMPSAASVSTATSPVPPPPVVAVPVPPTASTIPAAPRRSSPWGAWILLVLLGMAAGFTVFYFTPDIRRFLTGETSAPPAAGGDSSSLGTSPTRKDSDGTPAQDIDLDKYFKKVDRQLEDFRAELAQQRAADRAELLNEIDDLRGESARVLQNERDRVEAMGREIDGIRASTAAVDRHRPEPPADESTPPNAETTPDTAEEKPAVTAAPPASGSTSALERELERLKSPDAGVRFSAVVDLGRLADPNSVPALGALAINDGDNYVRDFAVRVLGNLGVPAAIPYLVRALHDSDALVANSANDGLVRMTKRSFGFDRKATTEQRQEAVRKWEEWWEKNRETFK